MKIRTQLALSFLLFTIVPLAGLSLYSYSTSIRAFRNVVQEESAALAKEMSHRMEAVTRDLQRRIHQLDRRPFYQLQAEGKGKDKVHPADVYAHILSGMGEMAPYLDSLEFPAAPPPAAVEGRVPEAPHSPGPPPPRPEPSKRRPSPGAMAMVKPGSAARHPDFPEARPGKGEFESVVVYLDNLNDRLGARDPGTLSAQIEKVKNQLVLKCTEPVEEGVKAAEKSSGEKVEYHLTEEQVRKITGEAERAAKEAIKNAEELKRWGGVLQSQAWRDPARWQRKTEKMQATMELMVSQQNGKTTPAGGRVGPIKAQIRADEVLARIFERGRFAHGEIQFAVDKTGSVHSPDPEKISYLEKLGLKTIEGKPASVQSCPEDWIVGTAFEPVSGMTFGIARPIGGSLQELRSTALRNLGIGFGFIALALLGIMPLSGRMTRNLSTLTKAVERLSRGDLEARVTVRSKNEFAALAVAFNKMASELAENQKRLVEQERLQKELEMCRRIQEVLLPREPLNVGFAEARGISIPARQVGGDFFNYFVLPEGDVAVLMGDVSGKGVPAALLMANLQARLQARLQVERNLARLAEEIDVEISRQTEPQTFATLFMGIISRDGRVLRWVNAGHNPQFVLGVDGRVQKLGATGKPIGLLPGDGFEEHQVDLLSGDFLFLYTDGLVEAEDPQGEEFGTDRLEAILMKERSLGLEQIVADLVEAVRAHRGGTEAGDDATLLALKVVAA